MNKNVIEKTQDNLFDCKKLLEILDYNTARLPLIMHKTTGCKGIIERAERIVKNIEQIYQDIETIEDFLKYSDFYENNEGELL